MDSTGLGLDFNVFSDNNELKLFLKQVYYYIGFPLHLQGGTLYIIHISPPQGRAVVK